MEKCTTLVEKIGDGEFVPAVVNVLTCSAQTFASTRKVRDNPLHITQRITLRTAQHAGQALAQTNCLSTLHTSSVVRPSLIFSTSRTARWTGTAAAGSGARMRCLGAGGATLAVCVGEVHAAVIAYTASRSRLHTHSVHARGWVCVSE